MNNKPHHTNNKMRAAARAGVVSGFRSWYFNVRSPPFAIICRVAASTAAHLWVAFAGTQYVSCTRKPWTRDRDGTLSERWYHDATLVDVANTLSPSVFM